MTPEGRAVEVRLALVRHNDHGIVFRIGSDDIIAAAIRAAVAEEREAIARIVDEWQEARDRSYGCIGDVIRGRLDADAAREYRRLDAELAALWDAGRGESAAADELRDRMTPVWYAMTGDEQDEFRRPPEPKGTA